jgi:hypothetical protein
MSKTLAPSWRSFLSGLIKAASFILFYIVGYVSGHMNAELRIVALEQNVATLQAEASSYKDSARRIDELQKQVEELKLSLERIEAKLSP